ncbi:hypothetical protein Csa_008505, partial [Cucumis sativus]
GFDISLHFVLCSLPTQNAVLRQLPPTTPCSFQFIVRRLERGRPSNCTPVIHRLPFVAPPLAGAYFPISFSFEYIIRQSP